MKIAINPRVYRSRKPNKRKTRRLIYLAKIAQNLGHEVTIQESRGQTRYDFCDLADDIPRGGGKGEDVFICSHKLLDHERSLVPKGAKVIAFKESLSILDDVRLASRADLIVGYVWRPQDWTFRKVKVPRGHTEIVWPKFMQVPWLPHEGVLDTIHKAGLTEAYLEDDLEPIRRKFGSTTKTRNLGFIGARLPHRSKIMAKIEAEFGYEIKRWAGGHDPVLPPAQYLKWLTGCRAVMHIEGDTWGCSRLAECAMMGVPFVQAQVSRFRYAPAVTPDNCIACSEWTDDVNIYDGLERAATITANATAAYTEGWSLRGQFLQAMERIK